MSRKTIRDRQVQEYLDKDKQLSALIVDSVRRGVSKFEPVLTPERREQLNMLDIQNVGEYINQFKVRLTDKLNIFDTTLNTKTPDMGKSEFAASVDKLTNYISDMIDYNRIIQVYLNMSNTSQTRIEIFNKIEPLKKLFEQMLDKFENLTEKFIDVDDADMYKRFFMKTLRSEALYDLIDDQFRNNNLFAISERDVQNQLMDIITKNPDVGDIIRDNGLDIKPPPAPPAPPAPAPPAPPAAAAAAPPARPAPPAAAPAAAVYAPPVAAAAVAPGVAPAMAAAPADWRAQFRPAPPGAAAAAPTASAPQGGRPVAPYVLSPEAREAMQQGQRAFGTLGYPSTVRQPQILDISTGDPDVDMEDDPMPLAKQLAEELFKNLIEQYSQKTLEELKEHYTKVLSKSNSRVKELLEEHLGKFAYYTMVKQQAPDVYGNLINLINDEFVNQLRKDVEIMIRNLSQSTKGQTVARSRVATPTLDISAFNPLASPRQRTRASAYVSPPRPILPISDQPKSPPKKRDVEQIEGIEEKEESPKSKARAKAATTKVEADDPRALTLEEQAKIDTVVNEFIKHEMNLIQTYNIDNQYDYLKNTIDKQGELQKELKNYIKRNQALPTALYDKTEDLINSLLEKIKSVLKLVVTNTLKPKLATEINRLEQEHRTLSTEYRQQKDNVAKINSELETVRDKDQRKALEVRKGVADVEEAKLLDKLNEKEKEQNKYDEMLTDLVGSKAEYDDVMSKAKGASASSTQKKPPPESDSEETIASMTDIKANDIFDTFMKRWQTDVLSGLSPEQLRTYVSNFTVDDMKNWFMQDGKKWKLIGPASTRKAPKVQAVFDIMDTKGIATLKKLVEEILQQRVVGMGIIRRKSKAKAKAKGRTIKREMATTPQPTIPQTMPPTGLQPQQYRQQLTATTITPQLTQQLAQQVAEQIKQQQATAQPVVAPATTGAGKLKKPKSKAKARLKPIKEGNEIVEVIKPPKMNLDYIDLNNDPYLINRIH